MKSTTMRQTEGEFVANDEVAATKSHGSVGRSSLRAPIVMVSAGALFLGLASSYLRSRRAPLAYIRAK
jgi:hypothetical protein